MPKGEVNDVSRAMGVTRKNFSLSLPLSLSRLSHTPHTRTPMQTRSGRRLSGQRAPEAASPPPAAAPSAPVLPSGLPPPAVDVPLLVTSDLTPLLSPPEAALAAAAADAASDDWVTAARALTVLRAGCVFHREAALAVM